MSPAAATAAVLTPPGKGGIAVIALTGESAEAILKQLFTPLATHASPQPGQLQLGHVHDRGEVIDEAIVAASADRAEINIHGGPACLQRTLQTVARLGAAIAETPADSGFDPTHPRWDNSAVGREMLRILPQCRSLRSAAAISQQWSAGLSEQVAAWLRTPPATAKPLRELAGRYPQMRRLIEPAEIVLAGPPNAGKSTLANALVGREVSIVHDRAGTTRDWVRELALIDGVPVWLTDTAGIWEVAVDNPDTPSHAAVDAESVHRARHRIEQAELVLLLEAHDEFDKPDWLTERDRLLVRTKADQHAKPAAPGELAISAITGMGLSDLRGAILQRLGLADFTPETPVPFTARQVECLHKAARALDTGESGAYRDWLQALLGAEGETA